MRTRCRVPSRRRILISALVALLPLRAQAQDATAPELQDRKARISMPTTGCEAGDEAVAREFWRVLSNDLATAGPFQLLPGEGGPAEGDLRLDTRVLHGHFRPFMIQVLVQEGPARKPLYRKTYEGSPAWLRRMAHRIADDFTERVTGLRGAAESRIVFAQETGPGIKEIFQVDRDGEGLIQLTHHHSLSLSPTLAPDGRLAYVTYKGGPPEIWGQRQPGGPHVRLFPTTPSERPGVLLSPAWAPVGNRLAFVKSDAHGRCDVMVLDLDRNRTDQLTAQAGINTEPAWDPAGKRIAFTSDREGTPQIFLMGADGSAPRRLTREGLDNSAPSWRPDGSHIAYESRSAGQFDVFVYDLTREKSTRVTQGKGSSQSPVWSPDGRWLAFTRSMAGTSRLMVCDLLGRLVRPLGLMAQVQAPEWSRSR
jgi:TolB protein